MSFHAIVLAAGQGTRMRSALPKVLQPVGGRPMLGHVLAAVAEADAAVCHVVLGHGASAVRDWVDDWVRDRVGDSLRMQGGSDIRTVIQEKQLGTAHAVAQALPAVPDDVLVVVLYGDVPLISPESLRRLAAAAGDGLALATTIARDPRGYGRILRTEDGAVVGIVEEKDASPAQREVREVNTGLLAAPAARLRHWLGQVGNANASGEYYLTDVVGLAVRDGVAVHGVAVDPDETEGVNDRLQLSIAERRYQRSQARRMMAQGLQLLDPERFDVRGSLRFGRDVCIDVGCVFEGDVSLGDDVHVGPYAMLRDVVVAAGARINAHSVLDRAEVGAGCVVGPFARLRPGAVLDRDAHVGNFVEVKNSRIGVAAKANHLAYVGDADIGARVNISAGVITCNYDGANKHRTSVGDDAFIGTDCQLVAPVTVGNGAFVAAGSTIARDVPAGGLTVCRAREQKTYPNWQRPVKADGVKGAK